MAFQTRVDSEPIPGYRLIERLGTGGYGEVWKATAPGGLTKAIKIVFGHIGDDRTEQELKALDRIRKVRHPFLLSLERFEIVDGQLFIVTELADMSLIERFEACKKAGMQGVPRDELLGYLHDAADALDYIQKNYDLQHLDIKPQNLLLVGGRIKIADFGLVKDLQGTSVTATGGVTPVYATPEAFDGRISRFSDQYSLAIVYQEMLTGFRPFPGTTALQLAAQHSTSPPLLTPLPVYDRPVVARALSKIPEQRFPTCREMIDQLLRSTAPPPIAEPPTATAEPESCLTVPGPELLAQGDARSSDLDLILQTEVRRTPPGKPASTPKPSITPKPKLQELESYLPSGEACLRPTLVLGIGGIGGQVVRRWKQRLLWRFGNLADVPSFRLLHLETDRRTLAALQEGDSGVSLDAEEQLFMPLHEYMHYRKCKAEWQRWIHRQWLGDIPKSLATEGKRPLGRLAFVDNASEARARLKAAIDAIINPISRMLTARTAELIFRDETPQVFVVASINGGTGGGMLLDVAYMVRQILAEKGVQPASPTAILLHAPSQRPSERELALGNAYAALREVHHCIFAQKSPANETPVKAHGQPFLDCYLLHFGDQVSEGQIEANVRMVGDYLYLNAATTGGGAIEHYRRATRTSVGPAPDRRFLRTFSLSKISVPRHRLALLTAEQLCKKMLQRWNASVDKGHNPAAEEAKQYFGELGLEFDALASRLEAAAETGLGEEPTAYFRKMLEGTSIAQAPPASPSVLPQDCRNVWQQIESFFGASRDLTDEYESDSDKTLALSLVQKQAVKLATELSGNLAHWQQGMVEDPRRRLPGAEAAAQAFLQNLRPAEARAMDILAELKRSVSQRRTLFAAGNFGPRSASSSWLPLGRRPAADSKSPADILISYAADRLRLAIVQDMTTVYAALDKQASEFLHDFTVGRKKLRTLAEDVSTPPPGQRRDAGPVLRPGRIELLPGGVNRFVEGAKEVLNRYNDEKIIELDQTFQERCLAPCGGLWNVLTAQEDLMGQLRENLHRHLFQAVLASLKDSDVADIFLRAYSGHDQARQALSDLITATTVHLAIGEGWRHLIANIPPGEAGDTLRELLHLAAPNITNTVIRSEGNIVFCQEVAHLCASRVAQELIGQDKGIKEIAPRLMTRIDVNWMPLEDASIAHA
jgi:serine/threonine protein kinase